jgi:filamentous hemagglutinin family protein
MPGIISRGFYFWQLARISFAMSGAILLVECWVSIFSGNAAFAQITPDETLGTEGSVVNPGTIDGLPVDLIEGGASRGANLFHSFEEFNVRDGQRVYFANPAAIDNILSRITGTVPSHILGTLGVNGAANLFLLNPNGIIFGSNARLDIKGSFVAATANSILFENGIEYSATNSEAPPLLTVTVPIGLQYGTAQPGAIVNAGELQVGQNLAVLAGTVANKGQLITPQGDITVAAIPGQTNVELSSGGELASLASISHPQSPTISPPSLSALLMGVADETGLRVTETGEVELTGTGTTIPTEPGTAIVSGIMDVSGDTGGTIQILAESVGLVDATINASGVNGGGTVLIGGDYQGVGSVLNANRTFVSRDSVINADGGEIGDGGQVIIWADETTGFYGHINARGGLNSGDGGFVEVSGKQNLVYDGTADLSAVYGNVGTLLLDPTNIFISNSTEDTPGVGGELPDILSGDFSGNSVTITQATLEAQPGNQNIVLEATNDIRIDSLTDNELRFQTGTGSITFRADADGDGVGSFLMNSENTLVAPSPANQPIGRTVSISGASITTGKINTRSGLPAPGGSVTLEAPGNITTGTIEVFADASTDVNQINPYNSGDITMISQAGNIDTSAGSLAANAGEGNAGTIRLEAREGTIKASVVHAFLAKSGSEAALGSFGNIILIAENIDVRNILALSVLLQAENDVITGDIGARDKRESGSIELISFNGNIDTSDGTIESRVGERSEASVITINAPGNITTGTINITPFSAENVPETNTASTIRLTSTEGAIDTSVGTLDAGTNLDNGGTITLNAEGDVTTGNLNSTGVFRGGTINLTSNSGNIDTTAGTLDTSSENGNGGGITLNTEGGDITTGDMSLNGELRGGTLQLTSDNGTIDTSAGMLESSSGNGESGAIALNTSGNIILGDIVSDGASGGKITEIRSQTGDVSVLGTINSFSSAGRGGTINFTANNTLSVLNGTIISQTDNGRGGDINLSARKFMMQEGIISANTAGSGQGGTLTLDAAEAAELNSGELSVTSSGTGNAGNLTVETEQLNVQEGATLSTTTTDSGQGGNLTVNADEVNVEGTSADGTSSTVRSLSQGTGAGGNIDINARTLQVQRGGTVSTTTQNQGRAGNLTLEATESVQVRGVSENGQTPSDVFSQTTGAGEGGDVTITTQQVEIENRGNVAAETDGRGQAGNLTINSAQSIALRNSASLSFNSSALSNPKDLTITTEQLTLENGARITATTAGIEKAGSFLVDANDVDINGFSEDGETGGLFFETTSANQAGEFRMNTQRLVIGEGGEIANITAGVGNGGILELTAAESIDISGAFSGVSFDMRGSGDASGLRIAIETGDLTVANGANVTVSGQGSGDAGTLGITANSIVLNNQGRLTATTVSGRGGNISLQVADSVLLRDDGDIRTNAQGTGDGGNITIEAGKFVLAFLPENSDIIATAREGRGGSIDATAAGVFGFRLFRDVDTSESDFTASSQLGIDGTVAINTRDNPIIELPDDILDADLPRGCQANRNPGTDELTQSRFYNTGRGGLPPNPSDALNSNTPQVPWVTLETSGTDAPLEVIEEAQGWVRLPDGKVMLTTESSMESASFSCFPVQVEIP